MFRIMIASPFAKKYLSDCLHKHWHVCVFYLKDFSSSMHMFFIAANGTEQAFAASDVLQCTSKAIVSSSFLFYATCQSAGLCSQTVCMAYVCSGENFAFRF